MWWRRRGWGRRSLMDLFFMSCSEKTIKLCRYKSYNRLSKTIALKEHMNRSWKRTYRKKINCSWNDYVTFVHYKNGSNFFNTSKSRTDDYLKINTYSKIIKNEILVTYSILDKTLRQCTPFDIDLNSKIFNFITKFKNSFEIGKDPPQYSHTLTHFCH